MYSGGKLGPVTASPAMWILNYPNYTGGTTGDSIFFATSAASVGGSETMFKLVDIYNTSGPTVAWHASATFNGDAAPTFNLDGSQVYFASAEGVQCFLTTNPATLGGAPMPCQGGTWPSSPNTYVPDSSPWFDYVSGNVFFTNPQGIHLEVDGKTGAMVWGFDDGSNSSHSSPLVTAGFMYVGDDSGNFYRIAPGAMATAQTTYNVCGGKCADSNSAVLSPPTADNDKQLVFVVANGTVFQFPMTGTWDSTTVKTVSLGASGAPTYSMAVPDITGQALYVGYNNRVYRVPYPFTGSQVATVLEGTNADISHPESSPTFYNGSVYVGDGSGTVEQLGCLTAGVPSVLAVSPNYGVTVDSTPLVDFLNGNIIFGYTNSAGNGGLVQLAQNGATWGMGSCGMWTHCATAGCGMGACVPSASCPSTAKPPSAFWVSNGGGTGTGANGWTLGTSICGWDTAGTTPAGPPNVTYGYLVNETF